jgi:riboflavin kinase/FMN adenylyltransferase
MMLLRGSKHLAGLASGAVVTIGNFDGVHDGHRMLLIALKAHAAALNLPTLVVFFEPQPSEYFHGDHAPGRLLTRREKLTQLALHGIDYAYCLPFDEKIARMEASSFARHFIFSLFKAKHLLIGEDFRFGCKRLGTPELLRQLGEEHDCVVQTYPDFLNNGARVSSTQIRQCLHQGHFHQAALLLGRPYSMTGRVVHGDARGRQWGIPTANIFVARRKVAFTGVFLVRVKRASHDVYWGVANLGYRPTVDGRTLILEVHLFNFNASLYHERLEVFFLKRLREEMKFSSVDALIHQIRTDLMTARTMIQDHENDAFPFYDLI